MQNDDAAKDLEAEVPRCDHTYTPLRQERGTFAQGSRARRERIWRASMPEPDAGRRERWMARRGQSETAASLAGRTRFHLAVEEFVTPVLTRLHDEQRLALNVRSLRPWDLQVGAGPDLVQPAELRTLLPHLLGAIGLGAGAIPAEAGAPWAALRDVGYRLPHLGREAERELAASAVELLAMLHAPVALRRTYLRELLLRWPVWAMVDALLLWWEQHPAATFADLAGEWGRLWLRFLPGVDWSGLEDYLPADLFQAGPFVHPDAPFLRAIAQLGAFQLLSSPRNDLAQALHPGDLHSALGIELTWNEHTVREAVLAIEEELER